jgi:alkylation response protein AidB-like acyl-CoA dehydrogenase
MPTATVRFGPQPLKDALALAGDLDHRAAPVTIFRDDGYKGLTIRVSGKTTASGTVILEGVEVEAFRVLPVHAGFENGPFGAISQLVHVAIDVGIARAALADGIDFVRTQSRPARDTGVEEAWQDPYTIQSVGRLSVQVRGAEALMHRASHTIDAAWAETTPESIAAASIAVAEAKVAANDAALATTNGFFELAGTRSTIAPHAYDRHWRNARTHTVHDPIRWKLAAIGNYHLNGLKPPLGGQI